MPSRSEVERRIEQKAREHPDSCDCKTCRAAAGDQQAMRERLNELV